MKAGEIRQGDSMAQGKTYTVQRGETIQDIAHQHGFRAWEPIWQHDENKELRAKRPNPHLLAKGDQIFIPEKNPQDHFCETNKKHTFRVGTLTECIQQTLLDENGEPLAGKNYELKLGSKVIKKKTNSEGLLKEEVPIDLKTAELKVWLVDGDDNSCLTWKLDLGHLEPAETTYGLKARLVNLGYDCGAVNDEFDEPTRNALRAFQRDNQLPATGEKDAITVSKLEEKHDRPLNS